MRYIIECCDLSKSVGAPAGRPLRGGYPRGVEQARGEGRGAGGAERGAGRRGAALAGQGTRCTRAQRLSEELPQASNAKQKVPHCSVDFHVLHCGLCTDDHFLADR